jgi:2-oxo-4-hydroxy-4-carboxy-5-ureidoimidazoline decarboxylase
MISLSELAKSPKESLINILGDIYENTPVVAERIYAKGVSDATIFDSLTSLGAVMKEQVESESEDFKLALLRAHPDLAGRAAIAGDVTNESKEEQRRAGLSSLTPAEMANFTQMNEEYKKKFNVPFILAVRNATKNTILSAFKSRLNNSPRAEFDQCLAQVHKIAWMRLLQKVAFKPVGFLTCHVLDTARGCPAAGMSVLLKRISQDGTSETIVDCGELVLDAFFILSYIYNLSVMPHSS